MIVKPWARAIAAIPGRPTPSPTTAAAPAPMNTKANVPMNSARSLGAIRLDIVLSGDGCAEEQGVDLGGPAAREERPPAREAIARYSAAIVCGLNLTPSAFATPAPYSGS